MPNLKSSGDGKRKETAEYYFSLITCILSYLFPEVLFTKILAVLGQQQLDVDAVNHQE